jgi:Tfp pilus assembly protein PilF
MTERFPEDPLAWGALATAAATAAEGAIAEPAFQAWVRLAPTDPDAHSNFGYFLYREGRATQAREVLKRATVQFPGNGLVWLNYAVALEALGEGAAASEARRRADALLTDEQRATLAR